MTKEQLERWRSMGFSFDDFYDTIAKDTPPKSIEINFVSITAENENYVIVFSIIAHQLKKGVAQIFIKGFNSSNKSIMLDTSDRNITLSPSGISNYKMKLSKQVVTTLTQNGDANVFKFKAYITCDGLSAETKEFQISDKNAVGKKNISAKGVCFCNRDFTEAELKNIVVQIRKAETTGVSQIVRDKSDTTKYAMGQPILNDDGSVKTIILSQFEELGEEIFRLELDEIVIAKEANYSTFNAELNKAFRNYKIKTCQQKIHFLAQAYHETQRFTTTYEQNPSSSVIGGPFYRGRGLLHLTHKPNYEDLFRVGSGEEPTPERLELFVPTVATSIKVACQAAAWFWNKKNINNYTNKDEITKISAAINYPKALNGVQKDINSINGLAERKLYFNLFKTIFKYDEICKNKK